MCSSSSVLLQSLAQLFHLAPKALELVQRRTHEMTSTSEAHIHGETHCL
jgi:hypothetical protein